MRVCFRITGRYGKKLTALPGDANLWADPVRVTRDSYHRSWRCAMAKKKAKKAGSKKAAKKSGKKCCCK